jgi:UDP-GlcNAc3NAcA epimerase
MRIISVVGTRPEIIKNLAFCRAAALFPDLDFRIAHSMQNFGPDMADGFFEQLGIPIADRNAMIDRSTPGSVARSLIDYTRACIEKYQPDAIISNTDTNTAFYAALAAAQMGVPVAHFEGGIRCEARLNPEEINRRLADHVSNWIFTISEEDSQALRAEGFPESAIFMLGDLTYDVIKIVVREHGIPVVRGDYDVLTTHRQENANNPVRLKAILDAVESVGFPTEFPIHPRTRDTLRAAGLMDRLERSSNIRIREPQGYLEMVRLVAGCRKVLSDSGGLRREAYMLDKPVISLVSFIWFKRMNELGYEFVADADPSRIAWALREYDPPGPRPKIFGDGQAGQYILRTIAEKLQAART